MLRILLFGAPVMILCLVLQSIFVTIALRQYGRIRRRPGALRSPWRNIALLAAIMLLVTIGSLLQVMIWAVLFFAIGEFDRLEPAIYYSAVNFSTLGYGDIVMSVRWRLLGPLEAFNGILMFGVSTAMMTAAVNLVIRQNAGARAAPGPPRD